MNDKTKSLSSLFLDICHRAILSKLISPDKFKKPGEFYESLSQAEKDRLKDLQSSDVQSFLRR